MRIVRVRVYNVRIVLSRDTINAKVGVVGGRASGTKSWGSPLLGVLVLSLGAYIGAGVAVGRGQPDVRGLRLRAHPHFEQWLAVKCTPSPSSMNHGSHKCRVAYSATVRHRGVRKGPLLKPTWRHFSVNAFASRVRMHVS